MPESRCLPAGQSLAPVGLIERRIHLIRGQKVMLSPNLADLYHVETRALIQAVRRNIERFPEDFLFQLSAEEFANLKSQIVTSSWGGARRATPYAFTELGVAMLSSVLRSKRAIQMNIVIMRAFVNSARLWPTARIWPASWNWWKPHGESTAPFWWPLSGKSGN